MRCSCSDTAWRARRLRRINAGTSKESSRSGFMQLKIRGAGTAFSFESNLEGFDEITMRAARAARANGVALDPTSMSNLRALGYEGEVLTGPDD